ncbi:MAG: hypothetical protein BWX63_02152 [Bacteroidetes bacterium ADurb.Bin041]|nr:MAG: hypothetical protein BWX63_02152 [Bacteroidetes bacterium ADurb.Bin041]
MVWTASKLVFISSSIVPDNPPVITKTLFLKCSFSDDSRCLTVSAYSEKITTLAGGSPFLGGWFRILCTFLSKVFSLGSFSTSFKESISFSIFWNRAISESISAKNSSLRVKSLTL